MEKFVSMILAMALVLSFTGCSGKKAGPGTVVTTFCGAIQAYDFEKAAGCMEHGAEDWEVLYDSQQLEEELDSEPAVTYLKECAAKMTYEIGEAKEDGESAAVPVTFTYVDIQPVLNAVLDEYITQAYTLAMSDADNADFDTLFDSVFEEQAQSVETDTASVDIEFQCVEVDGEWKIATFSEEDERRMNDLITGNMISAMEDDGVYGEDYEDDDDYEAGDDAAEITSWSDIPMGNGMELGTFCIWLTDCQEMSELPVVNDNPEKAPEGTKFVVFFADVENTTQEELIFNNEYPLSDNQDRSFDPYFTLSFLDFDEDFWYATLEPDETRSGVLIYNVTEDTEEYYLTVTNPTFSVGARLYADW